MIKRIYLLLFILQLNLLFCVSQNINFIPSSFSSYYFTPQNLGLATPQTTEFTKYGNQSINHYNGLLDLQIPLQDYKDADFDIPVSIKYISDGFMPSKRSSLVGSNWVLNVGGVITREVKGSPDDTKGNYNSSDGTEYLLDGFLVPIRANTYKPYSLTDLFNLNVETVNKGIPEEYVEDVKYDLAPDLFKFNFGKHSGSFIISNNGKPISLSDDGYIIDISGLTIQPYTTIGQPDWSTIKITTPDGYIYEFGGNVSYLEYFIPSNPEKVKVKPIHIISWYLKSITAPNKRIANFSYTSTEQKNKYKYYVRYKYIRRVNSSTVFGIPSPLTTWDDKDFQFTDRVFVPMLDNISIDFVSINFERLLYPASFYSTEQKSDMYYLNSISYQYNPPNNPISRKIAFSYLHKEKYFFLKTITMNSLDNNLETYQFDYKLDKTLPDPETIALEHRGYWNGGYNTTEDAKNYLENIWNRREVNTSLADITLLNKITYPTGGYTEIGYEYNRYNNFKEKDKNSLHYNDIYSSTVIPAGGARVKSIKDYDLTSTKAYNERTFLYQHPQTGKLSGVIGLTPKYMTSETRIHQRYADYQVFETYEMISSNTFGSERNLAEYFIAYTDVVEKFSDGSYNHYNFTSLLDIPDDESLNTKTFGRYLGDVVALSYTEYEYRDKFGLYVMNDMERFRGKLLKKITYSSTNKALLTETFKYNIQAAKNNYNISVTNTTGGFLANKIFLVPCRLEQQVSTDDNNVTFYQNYKYNTKNLVSEQETVSSNGSYYSVSYTYPFEYTNLTPTDNIKILTDRNIIEKPVQINKISKTSSTGQKNALDAIKYDYKAEQGMILINNLYTLETDNPPVLASTEFNSKLQARETYLKYDIYGNPISILRDSFRNTICLWGFGGRHIIAEIENATYDQVKTALGVAPESLSVLAVPDESIMTKLRNSSNMNTARITTYKYKPLVGIIEKTEPSGLTTYFKYDSSNRLKETYFMEGSKKNILELYDYHFKK